MNKNSKIKFDNTATTETFTFSSHAKAALAVYCAKEQLKERNLIASSIDMRSNHESLRHEKIIFKNDKDIEIMSAEINAASEPPYASFTYSPNIPKKDKIIYMAIAGNSAIIHHGSLKPTERGI